MGKSDKRGTRVRWAELCRDGEFQGSWVALDSVQHDVTSNQPFEGDLMDSDEDLGALCARVQASEHTGCVIVYCDDGGSGIRRSPG